jgi:protein SCO1/2
VRRSIFMAFACVWLGAAAAHAQHVPFPEAQVVQHLGDRLPLDTRLVDENGHASTLARYFGGAPVVLVFGYYRCPTLCTTLMEDVLMALSASGLAPDAYRVVAVGIDPRESAGDAKRKAAAYREAFGAVRLDLLSGSEAETRRLAAAAGVSYRYDARFDEYSHPLGFIVATPDGRISRYLPGVGFDPREVRLALVEASDAKVGSLSDLIFLRCAHYDPATGRYTVAVMSMVRAACMLIAAALGFWMWRRRRSVR